MIAAMRGEAPTGKGRLLIASETATPSSPQPGQFRPNWDGEDVGKASRYIQHQGDVLVRVLLIGHEPLTAMLTGPTIRCLEMAKALGGEFAVTLAVPATSEVSVDGVRVTPYRRDDPAGLEALARAADAIIISGYTLREFPQLGRLGLPIVVDVYDPFPIENLELHRGRPFAEQDSISQADFAVLNELLQAGDFFICGNERQRDFWLGMLAANGRINPRTYPADPALRQLIDVIPMGIPDSAPVAASGRMKGVVPGIAPSDFLVIWPGGVWDWLDPLSAIEAIRRVAATAPEVKLYFPGLRHPHPERVGRMEAAEQVLRRSEELGLLGRQVFYRDWTPYAERAAYLSDADAALSLHPHSIEAHLAIRARLLDCIWAEIPVIATEGDSLADALAQRGLAHLVPPGDPGAIAEAILRWKSDRDGRASRSAGFHDFAARYRWSTVCRPLATYLRQPHRASDHSAGPASSAKPSHGPLPAPSLASAHRRWQDRELQSLPFDQYQRHRQVAEIVEALRETGGESLRILDVGGGPAVTRRFLDSADRIFSVDLRPLEPDSLALAADAARLPFADATFDLVVSLDTLEHLPPQRRAGMIHECVRTARRGVIITAPVASPEATMAEHLLFAFIRVVLGAEHEQLREHLQNGLPDPAIIEGQLRQLGYPYLIRSSGYIHRWLAMMLLKHYILSLPQSESLHQQIDGYYNRFYYEADQCSPSYRSLFFIAKSGGLATLDRVSASIRPLGGPAPDRQNEPLVLSQLGLLAHLLTLKGHGAEATQPPGGRVVPEAELLAALARAHDAVSRSADEREAKAAHLAAPEINELRHRLAARETELAAARDLLDRIARGKVMRLLNTFHALAGRRK